MHPSLYALHPKPCTEHPKVSPNHDVKWTPCGVWAGSPTPYTLHPTPHTLHPTPCTLHPTPYTPHPTPYTPHPTPHTLHPTPNTPHRWATRWRRRRVMRGRGSCRARWGGSRLLRSSSARVNLGTLLVVGSLSSRANHPLSRRVDHPLRCYSRHSFDVRWVAGVRTSELGQAREGREEGLCP